MSEAELDRRVTFDRRMGSATDRRLQFGANDLCARIEEKRRALQSDRRSDSRRDAQFEVLAQSISIAQKGHL
jgi:hypothetical protein